ncbi:hypothetical protein BOTBODRAFT_109169, partial [Botryobasidium botryosum FD-172 SS1]
HVRSFVDFLQEEYREDLAELQRLLNEGKIAFNLLWGILVPGTILFTHCQITGDPCAVRLLACTRQSGMNGYRHWSLCCEFYDRDEGVESPFQREIIIVEFGGVSRILDLAAYPMSMHPQHEEMMSYLTERGKNWRRYTTNAYHHLHYNGLALSNTNACTRVPTKCYRTELQPQFFRRTHQESIEVLEAPEGRTRRGDTPGLPIQNQGATPSAVFEGDAFLATPIVYGFSLADRKWLHFAISKVKDIDWNEHLFDSIEILDSRKTLLKSLVQEHIKAPFFEDFVEEKGQGLVFNFYGRPGVGKTLTAEGISELAKRPLYQVGSGDLGTNVGALDKELSMVFSLATRWKAIVLIDEADVFLEQRSTASLERNAMVAVFLRYIEYFSSILILTTNRVDTFDEALQSRIHVSLHYPDLTSTHRGNLWMAFLQKARSRTKGRAGPSELGLKRLVAEQLQGRVLNGREIRNIVQLAATLAAHEGEPLQERHIFQVLRIHEDFPKSKCHQSSPRPSFAPIL